MAVSLRTLTLAAGWAGSGRVSTCMVGHGHWQAGPWCRPFRLRRNGRADTAWPGVPVLLGSSVILANLCPGI